MSNSKPVSPVLAGAPAPLELKRSRSEVHSLIGPEYTKRQKALRAYITTNKVSFLGSEVAREAAYALAKVWAKGHDGETHGTRFLDERRSLYGDELLASFVLDVDDYEADGVHAARIKAYMECLPYSAAIRVVKPEFQKGGSDAHVGAEIGRIFDGLGYGEKCTFNSTKGAEQMSVEQIYPILDKVGFGVFKKIERDVVVFLSCPLGELQANFFHAIRARLAHGYRIKVACYTGNFNVKGLLTTIEQLSRDDSQVDSFFAVSRFALDQTVVAEDGTKKTEYFPSNLSELAESIKNPECFDGPSFDDMKNLNAMFSQAKVAKGSSWVRSDELALADTKQQPGETDEAFAARSERAERAWKELDEWVAHVAKESLPADASREEVDKKRSQAVFEFFYDETLDSSIRQHAVFLLANGYVSKRRQTIIRGYPVIADQLMYYAPIAHPGLIRFVPGQPEIVRDGDKVLGMKVVPRQLDYAGTTFYGMELAPSADMKLLKAEMAQFLSRVWF